MHFLRRVALVPLSLALLLCGPSTAFAQLPAASTLHGTIDGTVVDPSNAPVVDAHVVLSGSNAETTTTDKAGAFHFSSVSPGLYSIGVTKTGFGAAQSDVTVVAGGNSTVSVPLALSSLTSLQTIGSVTSNAASHINSGAEAITTISQATLEQRSDPQTTKLLEEIPGVTISTPNAFSGNGSRGYTGSGQPGPSAVQNIQIRGGLSYETATLVDGHLLAVGRTGSFDLNDLNSYLMQSIEVAKGPGVIIPDIGYAINGTVNYRTLEPTQKSHVSVDFGVDNFGGRLTNARATGTVGKFGYAFDYVIDGTPGAFGSAYVPFDQLGPIEIPGVSVCLSATQCYGGAFLNGSKDISLFPACSFFGNNPPQFQATFNFSCPIVGTGYTLSSVYLQRAGIGKLRYNFSDTTSITASYLTSYKNFASGSTAAATSTYSTFNPLPGYTGPSFPNAGLICCTGESIPATTYNVSGLFQAELRTSFGDNSLLARYYHGSTYSMLNNPDTVASSVNLYGGPVLVNFLSPLLQPTGAPNPVFYTGQTVTIAAPYQLYQVTDWNRTNGYTFELDHPAGSSLYSVSVDNAFTDSQSFQNNWISATQQQITNIVPPGSRQDIFTVMLRAQFVPAKNVTATIADYEINYANQYNPNGSTYAASSRGFNGPRSSFVWQPNPATSVRLAAGSSIAPPYLFLFASNTNPQPDEFPAHYYTVSYSSGNVAPETAFGYNLGADHRVGRDLVLSGDVYLTSLHGQYLSPTQQIGTFYSPNYQTGLTPLPLYATQAENLGSSRYEGVELAITKAPISGLGFKLQASLQRAFVYNLPSGFYNTAVGPNTTNLGVIPNVNYYPSGFEYNGISTARIPYSQGYGELNYTSRHGIAGSIGVTYFGNNNSYNQPPFGVLRANLLVPLGKHFYLTVTGDNLTNAYGQAYAANDGGIPVPLANGKLGSTIGGDYGPPSGRAALHFDI